MNMKSRKVFLIPFLLFPYVLYGQEMDSIEYPQKAHYVFVKTQFSQYKDQFNYGLVFSGINLDLGYNFTRSKENKITSYEGGIAVGINSNKGNGISLRIKPLDYFYGFKLESMPITIGPYVSADYVWQLYPYIQSGHMFWFTAYDIGPNVIFNIPIKSRTLECVFSNSLFGFTSRPEPGTETYFYSLNLKDFFEFSHQNLKFGFFNNYNHSQFQFGLLNPEKQRLRIRYSFEYYGYYNDPKLSIIFHSLNLNLKLGKRHEN